MIRKRYAIVAALSFLGGIASGQSKPEDRTAFIWPNMPTTDDPRHIPVPPGWKGPAGSLVLTGGRVFDSAKPEPYAATIVVEHNRIKAILPPASHDWPSDARVIDVTGKTVMPGLIDMHMHLTSPEVVTPPDEETSEGAATLRGLIHLRYLIESGFTTVREMNSARNSTYILSEWMADDRAPGPRLFATGHIITGTGGHAADRPLKSIHTSAYTEEADGAMEWRRMVRLNFKNGASWIKIASMFQPDEVKAAVDEAHALGLRVACDCETFYIKWAVEAGVDMIEHPLPRTDAVIQEMAQHHTDSDPTLEVYQAHIDREGGYYNTPSRRFTIGEQQDFDYFKKMKAAGIRMGVGTDTDGTSDRPYIAELKWFVKGGYTKTGALMAATKTNADMLGMGDKLGTLEPGKLADILVVDGKPDENLDDLEKVDIVVKDGYVMVEGGQTQMLPHPDSPLPKPSPPEDVH